MKPLKQAAYEIGVPYHSVQYYHRQGKLPTVKVGRYDAIEPMVLRSVLSALGYKPRKQK